MQDLKPNDLRSKNAITLIWIVMSLDIIALISNYFQFDLLQTVANGGTVTSAEAVFNDIRQQIVGVVYSITYLISGIVFIQWFRRAYFNLHLRSSHLLYTDGWAAGSWFVPFLNLFRPFQIMKELYVETARIFSKKGLSEEVSSTKFLGWWWALWLINNTVAQYEFRTSLKAEIAAELSNVTIAGMIGNLISIPLAIITVKVVKDYAKMERVLHSISDEEVLIASEDTSVNEE
jgi:hypothetical protein